MGHSSLSAVLRPVHLIDDALKGFYAPEKLRIITRCRALAIDLKVCGELKLSSSSSLVLKGPTLNMENM